MREHTSKEPRFGAATWQRSTALSLAAHAGILVAVFLMPQVWKHSGAPRQAAVLWAGIEAEPEEPFDEATEPERVVDPLPLLEPEVRILPVPHEPEPFPEELPPLPLDPIDWASGPLAHATLEPVFAKPSEPEEAPPAAPFEDADDPLPELQADATRDAERLEEPVELADLSDAPPERAPVEVEVAARALADHCPRPIYPRRAQRMGWSGTVVCSMSVAPDGSVAGVEILQSSGHALLDETVRRTVHAWRFAPATRDGVARSSRVVRRFRFDLPS